MFAPLPLFQSYCNHLRLAPLHFYYYSTALNYNVTATCVNSIVSRASYHQKLSRSNCPVFTRNYSVSSTLPCHLSSQILQILPGLFLLIPTSAIILWTLVSSESLLTHSTKHFLSLLVTVLIAASSVDSSGKGAQSLDQPHQETPVLCQHTPCVLAPPETIPSWSIFLRASYLHWSSICTRLSIKGAHNEFYFLKLHLQDEKIVESITNESDLECHTMSSENGTLDSLNSA